MQLVHLATVGFRNLSPFELALESPFHVLHGANGHGKTNVLEAIYFLATLKPLRGHRSRDLIQWEMEDTAVSASCEDDGMTRRFRVNLDKSGRTCMIDGKKIHRVADYFGGVRCIAFTPEDGRIVLGEPTLRRNWIDRAAFTRSAVHLDTVRTFERLRMQKSAALRSGAPDLSVIDVLDEQLAETGAKLMVRRIQMIEELTPHIRTLHSRIVGAQEPITLRYKSAHKGTELSEIQTQLMDSFSRLRNEELRRRTLLAGPQRDDVELLLDDKPARLFGSRGQVRSIVLALKLAELLAARERNQHPIFLLDDLSSELDEFRTQQLVETLEQLGTQVFITTTDPNFLRTLPSEKTSFIQVNKGVLTVGGRPV